MTRWEQAKVTEDSTEDRINYSENKRVELIKYTIATVAFEMVTTCN